MKLDRHRLTVSRGAAGSAVRVTGEFRDEVLITTVRRAGPEQVTGPGASGQRGRPPGVTRGDRHHPCGRPADVHRHPPAAPDHVAAAQRRQFAGPQPGTDAEHHHGQRGTARLAGSRWAAARAASSARSAGEYGGGGLAPANGVPRCPGSPCTGAASRYSAERQVPRVEHARPARPGHAERLDHVVIQEKLRLGRDPPGLSEPRQPPRRRGGHRLRCRAAALHRSPASSRRRSPDNPTAYTLTASRPGRHAGHPHPARPPMRDPGKRTTMPAPDDHSADQAREAIAAALGQIGYTLPGSITIRRTRCGKPRCACKADPPALHGPYIQWTRTVNGKTVTRTLTQAQYDTYASWFANARRLRDASRRTGSPVPAGNGPGRTLDQDHPRNAGTAPGPGQSGARTSPKHLKRRETSPLNPGTALRGTPVTAGPRVLSLAHSVFGTVVQSNSDNPSPNCSPALAPRFAVSGLMPGQRPCRCRRTRRP